MPQQATSNSPQRHHTLKSHQKHFAAHRHSSATPRGHLHFPDALAASLFLSEGISWPRSVYCRRRAEQIRSACVCGKRSSLDGGPGGQEIAQRPCLFGGHPISPRVLRGTGTSLLNPVFTGFPLFLGSRHSHGAFWDHLPSKFLAPKSLPHDLLLGKPQLWRSLNF